MIPPFKWQQQHRTTGICSPSSEINYGWLLDNKRKLQVKDLSKLDKMTHSMKELEIFAEKKLNGNSFSYFANGTDKGVTLNENTEAFKRFVGQLLYY